MESGFGLHAQQSRIFSQPVQLLSVPLPPRWLRGMVGAALIRVMPSFASGEAARMLIVGSGGLTVLGFVETVSVDWTLCSGLL
jgi:hypothetical protein